MPDAVLRRDPRRDGGAAVVEFVMIAVLLVLLLFAVIQVAVFFYARNIVASSAADAARYAAGAGVEPRAGAARATTLIQQGLNAETAARIPCAAMVTADAASGLPVSQVHCRGHLKLLFLPLGLPVTIDVTATALKESAP